MENLKSAIVTVLGDEKTMGYLGLAAMLGVLGSKKLATVTLIMAITSACHTLFSKK